MYYVRVKESTNLVITVTGNKNVRNNSNSEKYACFILELILKKNEFIR